MIKYYKGEFLERLNFTLEVSQADTYSLDFHCVFHQGLTCLWSLRTRVYICSCIIYLLVCLFVWQDWACFKWPVKVSVLRVSTAGLGSAG